MKTFPVLPPWPPGPQRLADAGIPVLVGIPWAMLVPHAECAAKNHGGRSLEQLAADGGLDAGEIVAILRDWSLQMMTPEQAASQLNIVVARWLDVYGDGDPS